MEGGRWEWKCKGDGGEEGLDEKLVGQCDQGMMISVRRNCRDKKCTTELVEGVGL